MKSQGISLNSLLKERSKLYQSKKPALIAGFSFDDYIFLYYISKRPSKEFRVKRLRTLLHSYGHFLIISLVLSIPASFHLFTSETAIWHLGRDISMALAILWTPWALVLILLVICVVNPPSPDTDDGWGNDGNDDAPKKPSPDPNVTKKIVEKLIRESQEKIKNPSPV
jgi:transposase